MTEYRLEGGPFDGRMLTVRDGVHVVRMPLPIPVSAWAGDTATSSLSIETADYEKAGPVYRHPSLIRDAEARADVSSEAFADPMVRREARRMLRRSLQRLAPEKIVDRIVWVLAFDETHHLFMLAAVVGGHRQERAAYLRQQLRLGW